MPERLSRRPKDGRGFPTPFISAQINGKHDFRVIDHAKWEEVVSGRLCQLCGEPISGPLYFIGGPACAKNHIFFDPHMHRECAEYAIQVCPYLALPRFAYAAFIAPGEGQEIRTAEAVSKDRPERFCIIEAAFAHPIRMEQGDTSLTVKILPTGELDVASDGFASGNYLLASGILGTRWFNEGVELEYPPSRKVGSE